MLFLGISIFTYHDYGIAWDEPCQQDFGELAYEKLTTNKENPSYTIDKQRYGVSFELTLVAFQNILGVTDYLSIYKFRHFFTHLIFLFSAIFFYLILKRTRFKNLSDIGMLIYILSPRIYAHSFFNSKDIPLLCFTVFSLFLIQIILEKRKSYLYLILGFTLAYLVNIRIIGILIPFLFGVIEVTRVLTRKISLKQFILNNLLLLISFVFFLILFWPYLWDHPFDRFLEVFDHFKHFYWDDKVLFGGRQILANELPWYYTSTWIFISVPIAIIVFSFFGLIQSGFTLATNQKKLSLFEILNLFIIILPLILLPIIGSVVYDGWRHIYFIYPSIVFMGIIGVHFFTKKLNLKWFKYLIYIYLCFLSFEIINIHPHQQVYFNEISGKYQKEYLRENFEMDYWGIAYKQAIEKILIKNPEKSITISANTTPAEFNAKAIPNISYTIHQDSSDYFITNYRFHPREHTNLKKIDSIMIYNSNLIGIYQNH